MTTLIGIKVGEPYNAVVLGSDNQASFTNLKEVSGGTIHQNMKAHYQKIIRVPEADMAIAIAGTGTPQYEIFRSAMLGGMTNLPFDFDFRDDLNHGHSELIRRLNYDSATQNQTGDFNPNATFNLLVAYNNGDGTQLYRVANSGIIRQVDFSIMGSGEEFANSWMGHIYEKGMFPKGVDNDLSRATYSVMAGLNEASNKDAHSLGQDIVIVSSKGIESITDELHRKMSIIENRERNRILASLGK